MAQQSGEFFAETAKDNKEHLAMRSLWFQSAAEVWNRFGKGVFPQLEDGNSMSSDVVDGAPWCNSHRIKKCCVLLSCKVASNAHGKFRSSQFWKSWDLPSEIVR